MKVTVQEKKVEALKRMKALGIAGCIVEDFRKRGNVQLFEGPMGAGYWANDKMKEVIAEFEKRHDALVYTGIRSFLQMEGESKPWEVVSLLYVSDSKEEWENDNGDIAGGSAFAYVYNVTIPEFTDLGSIGFRKTIAGGLRRNY